MLTLLAVLDAGTVRRPLVRVSVRPCAYIAGCADAMSRFSRHLQKNNLTSLSDKNDNAGAKKKTSGANTRFIFHRDRPITNRDLAFTHYYRRDLALS